MTELICPPEFQPEIVLALAASLERYSKHPLAAAILAAASLDPPPADEVSEEPGEGLRGRVDGQQVLITGRTRVAGPTPGLPPATTGLECLVFLNQRYAGCMRFRDVPRPESRSFVSHLRPRHRFRRIALLSGDRETEVRYLAESVGIEEFYFEQSPEEKVEMVRAAEREGPTLFAGDGMNDAPALAAASVGIALGTRSDVACEAADAVVMEASLAKLDELLHIAGRMRRILLESALGASRSAWRAWDSPRPGCWRQSPGPSPRRSLTCWRS